MPDLTFSLALEPFLSEGCDELCLPRYVYDSTNNIKIK